MNQFFYITAAFLVATVLGKMFAAFGDAQLLSQSHPLLTMITYRQVLLLASVLEVSVASYLLMSYRTLPKLVTIASVSTLFLLYRATLMFAGYGAPCSCLGALTDPLPLTRNAADAIAAGVLTFMLFGSYSLLATHLWEDSRHNTMNAPGL